MNGITAAYDENYSSVLTPVDNSDVKISVGRMFGGSSSHNFGLTVRGSPYFYNTEWEPVLGLSYANLLPYMKMIERYTGDSQNISVRGTNGKIEVSQLPVKANISERIPEC